MKKFRFLALAFAIAVSFAGVTASFAQTTQEEYDYITKGYKAQIENKLDMKAGYSLVELGDFGLSSGNEQRICSFKGLVREGQTKPCAIMMVYKRSDLPDGKNDFYLCIPSFDAKDLWTQTLEYVNQNFKNNDEMLKTIIWSLMKLSSQEIAG